ncbi:MAG: hypothetical protein L3K26_12180 [Candidatus Hydrogenedentes bacterium]|nr:hypothetical protein [Candidatus Hydrogenedentota bacterium]
MFDVPGDMLTNDRGTDPTFAPSEKLYRRFPPEHYKGGMKIPIYAVELPDVSVNRSKHGGKAEYVLYDVVKGTYREHFGIVEFSVGDIPNPIPLENQTRVETKVSHEPELLNYFHSEIQAHDEVRGHLKNIEEDIDEEWVAAWRVKMRRALTVVKKPG